jgi:hypothetical protein
MTTLAPHAGAGAEAAPAAVQEIDDTMNLEDFPAWSSLSWEERAEYVARYCF